jgi:ATP-dependent helicase/DNAse subunit B
MYDEFFKYGYKTTYFDLVNNNFKIKYNSYSHKYQVIDRNLDKLYLSYTKLNLYNKCAFSYYLTDILKISIYETNFSAIIGSMVHYVLFKCLSNDDIDPEKYILEYIKPYDFNKKELFFLNKYTAGIKGLLDEIILEREYMLFNEALYEKKIDIDIAPGITFTGIIDKVLYYQDKDTTYVALIDYKTGNDDINLKYLKYGIDIQLPIYLYLSTKLDFTNMKYVGFYLQKMNMKDNDYRLLGYSNSNPDTISIIDKDYDKSAIIKGLKTNKDGSFAKSSNVLSDNEINDVLDEAKNQINKVIDKIKENDFTINPKNVLNKNISCKYCRFKDICFMDKDDEVTLSMEVCDGVDE